MQGRGVAGRGRVAAGRGGGGVGAAVGLPSICNGRLLEIWRFGFPHFR